MSTGGWSGAGDERGSGHERDAGEGYKPIRDYAVVGDCHGHALISRNGDVDWCCLEHHDQDPVFCRLLDAGKGGFLRLRPVGKFQAERRYRPGTNILETTFVTGNGEARLTDFMPVGRREGSGTHDYVDLVVPGWLSRRLEVTRGGIDFEVVWKPSLSFAEVPAVLEDQSSPGRTQIGGEGLPTLFCSHALDARSDRATGRVALEAGERLELCVAGRYRMDQHPFARLDEFEAVTEAFWREWIRYCRFEGPYREAVERSALALKLMTYAPSGAIVASLTACLPEAIGGKRNWDYRYSWLRDSCFALYALFALGYGGEAQRYFDYLTRCVRITLPRVQIMYGLRRERYLPEQELGWLEGYRGSAPVRRGNGAFEQRQIDVYGQVMDLAVLYDAMGGGIDEQTKRLLCAFSHVAAAQWCEPDQGMWEMRGPPRHHVHGKLMSWVAMERTSRLWPDEPEWAERAERIRHDLLAEGTDPATGALVQCYGCETTDASVLLAPMLGVELPEGLLDATIERVRERLGRGPSFLKRYDADDGMDKEEGCFLACSFWLVDALLAADRLGEARSLFEELVATANDVGLYSEEIDSTNGEFLGNFPQAFTHVALIGSAVNLRLHEKSGAAALQGAYADRAKRAVGGTYGVKGLLSALIQDGAATKLLPSKASVLLWP